MEVAQQDGERTGLALQFVAVGQALQIEIGACQQFFQDEALGYVAEVLSPFVTEVAAEAVPLQILFAQPVGTFLFFLYPVDVAGVFFQA